MEQKEKQILASIIGSVLTLGAYSLYVYHKHIAANPAVIDDFKFWGKAFLILIPVGIAVQIVIHIIFAIVNKIATGEDIPTVDDERDKLIELKSIRISHWLFTLGFFLAMGSQALGMRPWVMFAVLLGSGFLASVIAEAARISFYRRGH
ncbi:MAG TPA: hypothetical protein PK919_03535 [Candidatus Aminicenantes bacterium]|nr:hypothetical protein [Candidatus Aminicenantes bacterium]